MIQGVVVALLLPVVGRLADEILGPTAQVKRRHAKLREFELIGPIQSAFLRFAVRFRLTPVPLRSRGEKLVESGIAVADVFDVACFAPRIYAIDIDVRQGVIKRVKWIFV